MCEKLVPVHFFLCAPFFERDRFNGVASFEIVMFGLRKHDFSRVFAFPSTLHDELNSLKEPSTFKGKSSYHAEIFKRILQSDP